MYLPKIPNVLTIAGTDPTGSAGIQADLKAFSALGAYGMSVVTALVAQNTRGVDFVHAVPVDFVAAQIHSVFSDVRVDALKIGMAHTADVAAIIVDRLQRYEATNIVLDPVMVAKSGNRLLDDAAIETIRYQLLPTAKIVTPNLPEAGVLLGRDPSKAGDAWRIQVSCGSVSCSRAVEGVERVDHATQLRQAFQAPGEGVARIDPIGVAFVADEMAVVRAHGDRRV